jgi:pimeloyl-ACP methyl ester carboxylesterase
MGASTMEVVSADGFRIPVTEQGHGRPILIVHGGGGPSASWARVAGHLATRFRVLRFDRRTYRRPGGAEPTATMENEVNDVLAVAAAAGEQVVLVGHSSGAVVALEAALASPVPFAGMVLYPPRAHGQHVDSRQGRACHRALRRPGAALRKRKPPNYS